jgi:nitrite reductase/ring-hydroxylating ferredoxin subunit
MLLVCDAGTHFAIADICLRCNHSLAQGVVVAGLLACPHCHWQYDLARRCVASLPMLRVETRPVCEGGRCLCLEALLGD